MTCPKENEALRAINAGSVSPALARHIAGCGECAEAARIARALANAGTETNVRPGDARILWLLAAERRHAAAERKLERVIKWSPALLVLVAALVTGVRTLLTGESPLDGLLGASSKIGPVFLIAAVFVIVLVWTSSTRRSST